MTNESEIGIVVSVASFAFSIISRFWNGGRTSGADTFKLNQACASIEKITATQAAHAEKFAVQDQINAAQLIVNRQVDEVRVTQSGMKERAEAERDFRRGK